MKSKSPVDSCSAGMALSAQIETCDKKDLNSSFVFVIIASRITRDWYIGIMRPSQG